MHKQKWQQGFLMIDALIAIVVITIALVAIIGMFIQSTKATQCSAEYTIASNLAQQQMERLKESGVTLLTPIPDTTNDVSPKFTLKSAVTQCPENPTKLLQVTVTVSWIDQKTSYNVPFTTFFPKK